MTIKFKPRPLLLVVLLAVILLILGISWVYLASPVDKNDKKDIEVEITKGISVVKISNILKEDSDFNIKIAKDNIFLSVIVSITF